MCKKSLSGQQQKDCMETYREVYKKKQAGVGRKYDD
jgi:hypothetical protein